MKAYLAALFIFLLLITVLCVNYYFVNHTADDLFVMTDHLPALTEEGCYKALSDLELAWNDHENMFSISVSVQTLRQVGQLIAGMKAMAHPDHTPVSPAMTAAYESSRAQLLLAIRELRHLENWCIWNFM